MQLLPPYTLTTERLHMKSCTLSDAEDLFENYFSDTETMQFLQRTAHADIARTKQFIAEYGAIHATEHSWTSENGRFAWSIFIKNNPSPVGIFLMFIAANTAEIHFGLAKKFWGQRYMTEAGLGVMEWVKTQSILQSITTACPIEHHASQKVLSKIGLKQTRLLKNYLALPYKGTDKSDAWLYVWNRDS